MLPCVTCSPHTVLHHLIVSRGTMWVILVLILVVELRAAHVCTSGWNKRAEDDPPRLQKLSSRVRLYPVDPVKECQLTLTRINSTIGCFSCYKNGVKMCENNASLLTNALFSCLTWCFLAQVQLYSSVIMCSLSLQCGNTCAPAYERRSLFVPKHRFYCEHTFKCLSAQLGLRAARLCSAPAAVIQPDLTDRMWAELNMKIVFHTARQMLWG